MSRGINRLDQGEIFNSLFNTEKLVQNYVREMNRLTKGSGSDLIVSQPEAYVYDPGKFSNDEGDDQFLSDCENSDYDD